MCELSLVTPKGGQPIHVFKTAIAPTTNKLAASTKPTRNKHGFLTETWRDRRGRSTPSRPLRACPSLASRSEAPNPAALPPLSRLLSPSLEAGGEPYHLLLHHASREEGKRWPRRRQHLVGVMGMGSSEVATVGERRSMMSSEETKHMQR